MKYVMTLEGGNKAEVRHDIGSVVDIYKVAEQVRSVIREYAGDDELTPVS
ncbi:hypothetical protein [Rhodococcus tukisamuensis]|nr:hypothetical protein [Rhodococcus tukisamuensis]